MSPSPVVDGLGKRTVYRASQAGVKVESRELSSFLVPTPPGTHTPHPRLCRPVLLSRPYRAPHRLVVVSGDRLPGGLYPGAGHPGSALPRGGRPHLRRALPESAGGAAGAGALSRRAPLRAIGT